MSASILFLVRTRREYSLSKPPVGRLSGDRPVLCSCGFAEKPLDQIVTDWSREEIQAQLDDLGAFRRDTEAERDKAERALSGAKEEARASLLTAQALSDEFSKLERDLDAKLASIYKSTALWSHRAAQAGIPEEEVVWRLALGKGPERPPEDWEYEN